MEIKQSKSRLVLEEKSIGPKIIGLLFIIFALYLSYRGYTLKATAFSKGNLLAYFFAIVGLLLALLPGEFHMTVFDRKKGKISVAKRQQIGKKIRVKHYSIEKMAGLKIAELEHQLPFGKIGLQYAIVAKSKSGTKYLLTKPFWDYGIARGHLQRIRNFLSGKSVKAKSEELLFIEELLKTEELVLLVSVDKIELLKDQQFEGADAPVNGANVELNVLEQLKGQTDQESYTILRGVEKEEVTSTHTVTRFTEVYDQDGEISAIGFLGGLFLYFPNYLNKGRLVLVGKKNNYQSQKRNISSQFESWPYLFKMLLMYLEGEVGFWDSKMSSMEDDAKTEWLTYVRRKLAEKDL
ncbi:MAG: hypothetical protein HN509_01025 [Halobacteriovoraceae bacterium]|jgi:hypothetical protein|nr:hypothetical protein [Halobacteriovoraceae bacterium]MBT5092688.1 hypothetical protein [Halobacteriovoraceae bacterium]